MSSKEFNKENLNFYLNEFAKEFKKLSKRKAKIEIIIIGGGSALLNYGFRDSTYDIDAILFERSLTKEASRTIARKYDLPDDWLNADFMKSDSYSDKLFFHSEYYKTFANCVDVRTVTGKYLLAMKMKSGRIYKRDLSDIVGIIKYEDLTKDMIVDAVVELYGSYDIDDNIDSFVDSLLAMDEKELDNIFSKTISQESENKELLLKFNELYHIRLDRDKINQTIEEFKQSKQRKDD